MKNSKTVIGTWIAAVIAILAFCAISIRIVMDDSPAKIPTIRKEIIEHIVKDYQRLPSYMGVIIVYADIATNTSKVIYYDIADPDLYKTYNDFFVSKSIIDIQPLFVRDGDEINIRTTQLINHEFVCTPYTSLIASRYIPDTSGKIRAVCAVAVPPDYGKFIAMTNVLLSREPTEHEKELINIVMLDTATDIVAGLQ
jgi:hypothetical protein